MKNSSKAKGRYERHDFFFHKARAEGFLARSVFKLEEIDRDFGIFSPKSMVLDLGCAPGSWLQYVAERVLSGLVVGVDLQRTQALASSRISLVQGDAFTLEPSSLIPSGYKGFDVILSDMAPSTSGIKSVDQDRSLVLCERALQIANDTLIPGGKMVLKILEGGNMPNFIKDCKKSFREVKIRRPKSTRAGSMETYIIALQYLPS